MAEFNKEYGSRGATGAGLGLGIAGTALGVLNGGLGNILGGLTGAPAAAAACCHENTPVNRYELGLEQKVAELQSAVALRDANTYSDQKLLQTYGVLNGRIDELNRKLCDQAVWNATQSATIACMGNQIAQLYGLTKLVVPSTNVCTQTTTTG